MGHLPHLYALAASIGLLGVGCDQLVPYAAGPADASPVLADVDLRPADLPADLGGGSDLLGDSAADGAADGAPASDGPCTLGPWGAPRKVVELSDDSTDDWHPSISGDRRLVVFNSWRTGGGDLYAASRADPAAPWGAPWPLDVLNTDAHEDDPQISADGLTLVFSANDKPGGGNYEIFAAARSSRQDPFDAPAKVDQVSSKYADFAPFLTADGLLLYFASYRGGGQGGADIWVASRADSADTFAKPEPLAGVNSKANDIMGSLSADGLTIYFSSARGGGVGMMDIYAAQRASTSASFGAGTPIVALNTAWDDVSPMLSPDGRQLWHNRGAELEGGRNAAVWVSERSCE